MARDKRNWITREEIAQIYDAQADKITYSMAYGQPHTFDENIELASKNIMLRTKAQGMREIEKLGGPVGSRT